MFGDGCRAQPENAMNRMHELAAQTQSAQEVARLDIKRTRDRVRGGEGGHGIVPGNLCDSHVVLVCQRNGDRSFAKRVGFPLEQRVVQCSYRTAADGTTTRPLPWLNSNTTREARSDPRHWTPPPIPGREQLAGWRSGRLERGGNVDPMCQVCAREARQARRDAAVCFQEAQTCRAGEPSSMYIYDIVYTMSFV